MLVRAVQVMNNKEAKTFTEDVNEDSWYLLAQRTGCLNTNTIATKESFFNSKESLIVNIYCRNTCPYCYHYSLCCNFNLDVGSVLQSSPFLKLLMKKLVTLCEPSTCYDDLKRT